MHVCFFCGSDLRKGKFAPQMPLGWREMGANAANITYG
jgi:hypothetical protein